MGLGCGNGNANQWTSIKGPVGPSYSNLYSMEFVAASSQALLASSTALLGTAGTGAWTVSLWFSADALGGTTQRMMDINQGGGGDRLQIYINTSNGVAISGAWTDSYAAFALSAGTWFNLIYRYNGNAATANNAGFVMNGTNINNVTNKTWAQVGATGTMRIGRNSAGGYFDGYMDEVSIFNSYLSDAQCIELYNGGTPTDLATSSMAGNLQHWWRMGDPTGTGLYPTIPDAAGSISLTMQNMVSGNIQTNVP